MLDENTMVVAYDYKRGEKRSPVHRGQSFDARTAEGFGDCINCHQCVAICPTGIDIRNGTQMECVNCTACIDACDSIMDKVKRPRGLIRFASLDNIERGLPQRFTSRMKLYTGILAALIGLWLVLVFTRSEVETAFLRAPGSLFQQTAEGRFSNLYTMKVVNKTSHDIPVQLRLEGVEGRISVLGADSFVVPKEALAQTSVLIELSKEALRGAHTPLKIGIYSGEKQLETVKTVFIGPRN